MTGILGAIDGQWPPVIGLLNSGKQDSSLQNPGSNALLAAPQNHRRLWSLATAKGTERLD